VKSIAIGVLLVDESMDLLLSWSEADNLATQLKQINAMAS
jgi:hypothetical protein